VNTPLPWWSIPSATGKTKGDINNYYQAVEPEESVTALAFAYSLHKPHFYMFCLYLNGLSYETEKLGAIFSLINAERHKEMQGMLRWLSILPFARVTRQT